VQLPDLVADWYRANARDLPWRRSGTTPWGVLVSEFMLQQTPVARVEPIWREWMERWPRPSDLAAAPRADVLRAWGRLGYPRRALRLHEAAQVVAEQHGDVVPESLEALESLPGVGSYTARAVAAFGHGRRSPVVDTNVRRVVARAVHGAGDAGPARVRADLADVDALLPPDDAGAALVSVALMELGAVVCTTRTQRCPTCPARSVCAWQLAGRPDYTGPRPSRASLRGDRPAGPRPADGGAAGLAGAGRAGGAGRRVGRRRPARPLPRLAAASTGWPSSSTTAASPSRHDSSS
jgi:A/G-specific adenine glycosylase